MYTFSEFIYSSEWCNRNTSELYKWLVKKDSDLLKNVNLLMYLKEINLCGINQPFSNEILLTFFFSCTTA